MLFLRCWANIWWKLFKITRICPYLNCLEIFISATPIHTLTYRQTHTCTHTTCSGLVSEETVVCSIWWKWRYHQSCTCSVDNLFTILYVKISMVEMKQNFRNDFLLWNNSNAKINLYLFNRKTVVLCNCFVKLEDFLECSNSFMYFLCIHC